VIVRPGPERLAPGLAPGGWVAHVYGAEDGRLVYAMLLLPGDDLEHQAAADAEAVLGGLRPGEALCLVLFDGDTGERRSPFGLPGSRMW
jgi:hypothetical protein